MQYLSSYVDVLTIFVQKPGTLDVCYFAFVHAEGVQVSRVVRSSILKPIGFGILTLFLRPLDNK